MYYIDTKDYTKALEELSNMPDEGKKNKIMLRYASLFINSITKLTIESLMSNFQGIMVEELIPALMSVGNQYRLFANTFVRESALKHNSKLIYDLYIFFLAQSGDIVNDELSEFLEKEEAMHRQGEPLDIDREFALNVFKFFGKRSAATRAYSMLELYEEAVKTAISAGELKLAKEYASEPKDEKLRKKLWQQIAGTVLNPKEGAETQTSFALVSESQGNLVLNDVLHLVSPKIKLKTFRDDILNQVKIYDSKIESFRGRIAEYNESARGIGEQYKLIHSSAVRLPPDKCCDCCEKLLVGPGTFLTFPCLHGFHLVLTCDDVLGMSG